MMTGAPRLSAERNHRQSTGLLLNNLPPPIAPIMSRAHHTIVTKYASDEQIRLVKRTRSKARISYLEFTKAS